MKIKFIKNRIITGVLASALIVGCMTGLTGCGEADKSGKNMSIELIEPIGAAETMVVAQYRNIYNSDSYSGIICPKVVEYSYDSSVAFSKYGLMPGETVVSGDSLILGDTTQYDKQIENLEKSIKDMEDNHLEKIADLNEQLSNSQEKMNAAETGMNNFGDKPKREDFQTDDEYENKLNEWQAQYNRYYVGWESDYYYATIEIEKTKQKIKETQELYDLDHKYQVDSLNKLKNDRRSVLLKSDMNGSVVACGYFYPGLYISGGVPAMAVGDLSVKEIKCEFINKNIITKAESVYAMVNGVKYDVEYQTLSSEEYARTKEMYGNVYSTFTVDDPEDTIKIGDYVVIVIVNDLRENVLCVPKSSIGSDDNGSYVYKFNGSSFDITYVKTGINDGLYTEILSGLEDGDMIKSSVIISAGSNQATVTYGSVNSTFSDTGTIYYPSEKLVNNEIKYGIVYLDEICVEQHERVVKGQVLVRVHVVADTIEIARQERILLRQKENLQKLIDEDKDRSEADKRNTKAIAQAQENINDLQDTINEMKRDGNTTEIVATVDGIVNEIIYANAGDLLNSGRMIAKIADENKCFIRVTDSDHKLTYGNEVEVTYRDKEGTTKIAKGSVVSINNMCVTTKLQHDDALIQIPAEDIAAMSASYYNGDSQRRGRQVYKVTATLRSVENVLVIPRRAVTEGNSATFVTVMDENGTLRRVSFVAGGSDSMNYWVAEGLTEGMVVCWE